MIDRINRYLLTHHPLLWNTRVAWVLGVNLLLHALFLAAGFGSVNPAYLGNERGPSSVGGTGLVPFSVLCSLLVLLLWMLFYFRNNAFRNGYRLGPGYLLREWGIVLLIVFSSLTYYESFFLGMRLRVRQYTGTERFVDEVNRASLALGFLPDAPRDPNYFVLNNCAEDDGIRYEGGTDYEEQARNARNDTSIAGRRLYFESMTVLRALQQPDAFSYRHYCAAPFSYSWEYAGMLGAEDLHARRARWLAAGARDSVRAALDVLVGLCRRYGIESRVNTDSLAAAPFRLPGNALWTYTPTERFSYSGDAPLEHASYLPVDELRGVFSFIDDCLPNARNRADNGGRLLALGYTAFALSLLLWAWRRFSRRVFLVSIVGALLWSILIGLMSLDGRDGSGPATVILLLFVVFGFLGWLLMRERIQKTAAGALLLWHYFLSGAVVPLLLHLVDRFLDRSSWDIPAEERDRLLQANHPVLYWINEHSGLLLTLNFALLLLYIGVPGNRAARRWQPLPEE